MNSFVNKNFLLQAHCIQYGCSDPKKKYWSSISDCEVEEEVDMFMDIEEERNFHGKNCDFCEGVLTLFKILTGLLEKVRVYIPPEEVTIAVTTRTMGMLRMEVLL